MTTLMRKDVALVTPDSTEELIQNIKCKTHLLENDRKAYCEMAEATIKRNKEIINDYRQKNKALRTQVSLQMKTMSGSDNSSKISKLDQQSAAFRNKINLVKAYALERQAQVKQLQDNLDWKTKEAETMAGHNKESAEMKKLRMLENRLDKAMIKSNEAQSIRKTYQQIVKRLQEDRLKFDSQIDELELEIKEKRRVYHKLDAMSTDAKQRDELARQDLARVENHLNDTKARHEKDLEQRRVEVDKAAGQNQTMRGPTQNQSKTLTQQVLGASEKQPESDQNSNQLEKDESSLVEYGKIWYKIKSVTGAATFDDVITAVKAQKATEEDLLKMKEVSSRKIVEKKEECEKLCKDLETLKFTNSASSPAAKIMEDMELYLEKALESRDQLKAKSDRSEKTTIATEAAVSHLCQKLGGLKLPYESKDKGNRDGVEMLHIVESKLVNMLRIAEEKNIKQRLPSRTDKIASAEQDQVEGEEKGDTDEDVEKDDDYEESFGHAAVQMIPAANTRIMFDGQTKKTDDDSEDEFGGSEFTDDRKHLKRRNQYAALNKSTGKKR